MFSSTDCPFSVNGTCLPETLNTIYIVAGLIKLINFLFGRYGVKSSKTGLWGQI